MIKTYTIIITFILLSLYSTSEAAIAPELLVNDSTKECQMYGPNAREDIVAGWRNSGKYFGKLMDNTPEKYCTSLGYTFHQDRTVASVKPIFKTITIIFWIIFAVLTYLYYRIFLRVKRKYVIFSLCVLVTAFVLVAIVHPFVIYQMSPCASSWTVC